MLVYLLARYEVRREVKMNWVVVEMIIGMIIDEDGIEKLKDVVAVVAAAFVDVLI